MSTSFEHLRSIPSAWRGHEDFCLWLIDLIKPSVICELGADFGYSAIVLASRNCGHVYAIDHFQGDEHTGLRNAEDECRANVAAYSNGNVSVVKADFAAAAAEWSLPIDLLHIDGAHSYEQITRNLADWLPHVRPGGVILAHDTSTFSETVGRAFGELNLPKFTFQHSHGLGVAVKPGGARSGDWRLHRTGQPVGLVIGTFAALPYIHLQLEARRRMYPHVPALIHDDASPNAAELEGLAHEYECEFVTSPVRKTHHLGDLNIYPVGLAWAKRRQLSYLLKVSRRWIWLEDWTSDLMRLFEQSGAPTLSSYTISYAFGFRTECVAFDVEAWLNSGFAEDAQQRIDDHISTFVENYIHIWAQGLSANGARKWLDWSDCHPTPEERSGYAEWPLMGNCRHTPCPSHLWHDSHPPEAYASLAKQWGLSYRADDFRDPNMSFGVGDPS